MTVREAMEGLRPLLARRSVVRRRLALLGGPGALQLPRLDGMPRSGWREYTCATITRLEALVRERDELEDAIEPLRNRVAPLIDTLPIGPHRTVLKLRYLDGAPVEEVAWRAGYERRYTYKLLIDAERKLEELDTK